MGCEAMIGLFGNAIAQPRGTQPNGYPWILETGQAGETCESFASLERIKLFSTH